MRQQHWYQWRSSLSAQLSQPSTNTSSARPDLRIADTAVLRERTLAADRPDADTLSIALISLDSLFFMRLCCGRVRIGPFAFPIGAEPSIAKRFRTVLFSSLLA